MFKNQLMRMITMDNMTGFVINIKKSFPNEQDVSFMQFLMRFQLRFDKSAVYYKFKKDAEIIGIASISDFYSDKEFKNLGLFLHPSYRNMGLCKQILNFVTTDCPEFKLTSQISSNSTEEVSSLESLGFHIIKTSKIYIAKETDLIDRLPRCFLSPISKTNKALISEFESKFISFLKSKLPSETLAQFATAEIPQNQLKDFIDYKNSYLFIEDGIVNGWLLCEKPTSSCLKPKFLTCLNGQANFLSFIKDAIYTIFRDYMEILFRISADVEESKILSTLFSCKPVSVEHTYIKD